MRQVEERLSEFVGMVCERSDDPVFVWTLDNGGFRFDVVVGYEGAALYDAACAVASRLGIVVQQDNDKGFEDTAGWFDHLDREIFVRPAHANQQASVILHELAHSLYGTPWTRAEAFASECVAETVAYLVTHRYGLDTLARSLSYVAAHNVHVRAIDKPGIVERIGSIARDLIGQTDAVLSEQTAEPVAA